MIINLLQFLYGRSSFRCNIFIAFIIILYNVYRCSPGDVPHLAKASHCLLINAFLLINTPYYILPWYVFCSKMHLYDSQKLNYFLQNNIVDFQLEYIIINTKYSFFSTKCTPPPLGKTHCSMLRDILLTEAKQYLGQNKKQVCFP